jgi:hypothetical protein
LTIYLSLTRVNTFAVNYYCSGFQWSTGGKGRYTEGLPNEQGYGMYLPGILTPLGLPSSVMPVFPMADLANNAMWQNVLPPGITPAEYANYMSRMTNGMIGNMRNHDAEMMFHLNQPHPQNMDMIAYQYHQMNPHLSGDNPFPPKPN